MSTILKAVFPDDKTNQEEVLAQFKKMFVENGLCNEDTQFESSALWVYPSFGYMQEVGVSIGYPYRIDSETNAENIFDKTLNPDQPRLINERISILLDKMQYANEKLKGTEYYQTHIFTTRFVEKAQELGLDLELSF